MIMKNLILSWGLLICLAAPQVRAQVGPEVYDSIAYMRQYQIYMAARKYSDPQVERVALYNMLMMNPAASAIADSLALIYLDNKRFASAALLAQDILTANPKDGIAQEVGAYAFEQLGLENKALPLYESIYLRNNDIVTLYKISLIQFKQGNYAECTTNFDIILSKKEADEIKLYFTTENEEQQEIPLRAAVFNMKGLLAKAQENKEEATKFYKQALLVAPEFNLARTNLEELEK